MTLVNLEVAYPFNAGFSGPESFSSSEYSVKDLGEVGPNGEQLFSITLTANPNWGNNFGGKFKLTLDPTVTGQYSYNEYTAPLVSELASDGQGWNNGNFTGFTIDGKHVDVVNTEGYASSIQYAVNQALKPTFTGTATLGNLSNGTFVSANSTNYTADTPTTDLPTLNVRLSTHKHRLSLVLRGLTQMKKYTMVIVLRFLLILFVYQLMEIPL